MQRVLRWLFYNVKYLGRPPWDTGISPPELLAFMQTHPAGRALDLGCGTGTNLVTLAKAGWQVTGVDYVLKPVLAARQKLRQSGCQGEVLVGDVTNLRGVSGPFDLVFDIGCYHGLPLAGRPAYRAGVSKLLAPDGFLLIYAHYAVPQNQPGIGIQAEDVQAFQQSLRLIERRDSEDRWGRRATWMTFQKGQAA